MDSEDSRDGNDKSSSSSSSSSRSGRSNSSESSVKQSHSPRSPSVPKPRSPSHSPSPNSRSQSSRSPSPKNIHSPDNLSDAHSNINSPENLDGGTKSPNFGPKTPESPVSPMSESRSQPASPVSSSSPAQPASPSSPSNEKEWKRRSRSRSYGNRDKSSSRERSHSDSSRSSRNSSYNKRSSMKDPTTEAISDGEMESDHEDNKKESSPKDKSINKPQMNMSHEDLSDVSDLDSMGTEDIEKDPKSQSSSSPKETKQEFKTNGITSPKQETDKNLEVKKTPPTTTEDVEDQLDFEAEEGECIEPKPRVETNGVSQTNTDNTAEPVKPGRRSRGSSLEEGEVSDEGERRPEESEPRPVCRFYSRGACTWGVSCRFLHPGVTDKGNYSMFEVIRGVAHPTSYAPRESDVSPAPIPSESAWERGLRTAKEMVRIANKRKEQDMDFEEKKLHLSVGGVVHDPDAELAYAAAAVGASPPPVIDHAAGMGHREMDPYRGYGPMYRPRFPGRPVLDERDRYYERDRMYERGERGLERIPPLFDDRIPPTDEAGYHKSRRVRSSREVIVQRAEVSRRDGREGRDGRVDEWADPWMRASPATKRRKRASSEDSYSSTSSSNSSSHSSRSRGRKRRASSSSRQRVSPAAIVRERRMATARATAMNPPAPRRRAPSPAAARQHSANPPPPASTRYKDETDPYGRRKQGRDKKRFTSSSGSESSSSSSESESESHSSSSSGSTSEGARRGRNARLLNAAAARPRVNAKSSAELAAAVSMAPTKKDSAVDLESTAKKRPAQSPIDDLASKSVSRREELLKQLKAVEDAIARKRSKT